jgi:predicted O-linked N-acetylglucosamine transferase (SPINDLY family)
MPAAPRHFDVWNLAGLVAYQQQRLDDAIKWLGKAHGLNPTHAVCAMHYGLALLAARRATEAGKYLQQATALEPAQAEAWENWAYFLKTQDRLDEAVAAHEKVAALRPYYGRGWYNFGLTLSLLGRAADALACHDRALRAEPKLASAHFGRGQALLEQHRVAEAVAAYDAGLVLDPGRHEARSHRLLALHALEGLTREQLFAEHLAYGRAVGRPPARTWSQSAEPDRRLRVAVLSLDLREHSCAYFIEPILRHLDPAAFELYLYHDHFREDATTVRLKALATVWRNFVGQPGETVEAVIRADAPDILIDLAGHTGLTSRLPLLARRLAPVQINYLGYPNTTGVPAMDYRFTDEVADPTGPADELATEKLVRFAPTAWCFAPAADAPPVGPSPCLSKGHVTFGCFNKPAKITDATVALWSRVLQAVPESRLMLKGAGFTAPGQKTRFAARFAPYGIAASRLEFAERTPTNREHLACYGEIDIALDTAPYNGTTTTCESLWMGVPTVALIGDRHMARVSASLLAAAGHADWATPDADAYVARATELARIPAGLAAIRAGLRDDLRRGPLLDEPGQARRFGEALRDTWAEWCRTQDASLSLVA